jgi:hypothetical protein
MSSASSRPPWFALGDAAFQSLAADPRRCAHIVSAALARPSPAPGPVTSLGSGGHSQVARVRLQPVTARGASLRRQGKSLCSRQRKEAEISQRLREAAIAAQVVADEAARAFKEAEQQLEEGVILPDGNVAPIKKERKRKSEAGEGPSAGTKRKSPSGDGEAPVEAPVEVKRGPGRPPKKEVERLKREAEKAKKAEKRKSGVIGPFHAGTVVEVSLRLGEAFANWYEGRLIDQSKSGKWKLSLCRRGLDDSLVLQGRGEFESATVPQLRPIPPNEPLWEPSVGEFCELLYEDGWWKVRVQEAHPPPASGEAPTWTVNYMPAQAVHTVGRERLRPVFTWDLERLGFAPIKVSARGGYTARSGRESA